MIDLHCHIYPKIDDGPVSLDETKAMLSIAKKEGISTIVATHHFYEEEHTVESYLKAVNDARIRTQPIIDELELDICIIGGAEVFISPFIAELKDIEKLCINGSRYLLIELPMAEIPQYTEDVIYSLNLKGIRPIIAHPERNRRIISQVTAADVDDVAGVQGDGTKQPRGRFCFDTRGDHRSRFPIFFNHRHGHTDITHHRCGEGANVVKGHPSTDFMRIGSRAQWRSNPRFNPLGTCHRRNHVTATGRGNRRCGT